MIASALSRTRQRRAWLPLPGLAVLLLLFCAPPAAGAAPYEQVTPPTLRPGDPIPAAKGRAVLEVFGAVNGPGEGAPLRLDLRTLERLGTIRFTSRNNWYDRPVTYEGVLGSVFLRFVGVPPGATKMKMRALNDYVTRIPIEDFLRWPVMLALKLNGEYMSVRDKGPIWIVYPNHLDETLMSRAYQGRWIWQLAEIRFE